MKTIIQVFLVYAFSTAALYFLYYIKPRPIDWHHLFAYLTMIGLIGLLLSGAVMVSKRDKWWINLHIIFGVVTSITLVLTLFLFRYAIPY